MEKRYPPLGKLIKFAFDAAGVLPRKRGECDGLTEKDKKLIQTQLKRLASEDGVLTDRCGELIRTLAFITAGTITNPKVNLAIGETAIDLLDVYNSVIKDEGTFLNEKNSIRWFCSYYAIPRLAISIQKHRLRFNIEAEEFVTPVDVDWFLPTIIEGQITSPLTKAMQWVYEICETSRTHFHYPDKIIDKECAEQQQNLENASDWLNGKRMPSWAGLYWNFTRSFDRQASIKSREYRNDVPVKLRESIIQVLFLARLSTFVCKGLADMYGEEFLFQLVAQFKMHQAWLLQDLEAFQNYTKTYINENQVPPAAVDEVWWHFSEAYWSWFSDRQQEVALKLQSLLETHNGALPSEVVTVLAGKYGDYTVKTLLEKCEDKHVVKPPEGFAQALHDGFNLKAHPDCSDADIDQYALNLKSSNLDSCIPWMEPWLRGAIRYHKEEYETAFLYTESAFLLAKYNAGRSQYKLVNQFIELAAKTDRWKCFKKGVEWALYLGLSVRWLRDDEPTDKKLRDVFNLMKKVRYAQF